ncbi:Histone PARylation factor 1-like [Anthophora quadrimaculata]
MSDNEETQFKAYREDKRIPCRYGSKCYQKNPTHHEKYKHPPTKNVANGTKRMGKRSRKKNIKEISNDSTEKKRQKKSTDATNQNSHGPLSVINDNANENNCNHYDVSKESTSFMCTEYVNTPNNQINIRSLLKEGQINIETDEILQTDAQKVISHLFLMEMPEDFFQFYEFCKSISDSDSFNALKNVHLQLIGPYDVFQEKFLSSTVEDKEALLRHWRYYYDPPEFQTVIKDNGKDGLHYGYWRDDASKKPVFIGKNRVNVNCLIEPVAENIFGAIDTHIGEKLKLATPFNKLQLAQLHQKLRSFAKERKITLEKKTTSMQAREMQVVAKTFHKVGIVVPYNKKTQLGYRDLAVSDNELQKLLKQIEHPPVPEARKTPMSKLEEVIRLAIIAADECDFGTVLELGHDLFSSGVSYVQPKALNLLTLAYNLLQKPQFLEIAQAHLKCRRKSLDLSVIQFP